jgi:uncharacterized repeat protein (TIGR01451 family)
VITLRNLGTEAATDVSVGFASRPGLDLEAADSTAGRLEFQAYQTVWHLPQFDPGASAEVRLRSRATLPDANVLTVAVVDEMDQTDTNPLNNSAEFIIRPRAATARLSLAMTIDPSTAKVGGWVPVRLTVRNEGPDDATQVILRTYLPPGASLVVPDKGGLSSSLVIPRLTPGAEMQFVAAMVVLFTGKFTLIANATYLEEQLAQGSAWPEARADFDRRTAFARPRALDQGREANHPRPEVVVEALDLVRGSARRGEGREDRDVPERVRVCRRGLQRHLGPRLVVLGRRHGHRRSPERMSSFGRHPEAPTNQRLLRFRASEFGRYLALGRACPVRRGQSK